MLWPPCGWENLGVWVLLCCDESMFGGGGVGLGLHVQCAWSDQVGVVWEIVF